MRPPGWLAHAVLLSLAYALLAFAVAFNLNALRERDTRLATTIMQSDALLVGTWIGGTFALTNGALREIVRHVEVGDRGEPGAELAGRDGLTQRLVEVKARVPNAYLVGLFDSDCVLTHANVEVGLDATERAFCRALRDDGRDSVVTNVHLSAVGTPTITVAKRVPTADGSFVGFAALGLDLAVVDGFLERLDLSHGSTISVVDSDLQVVARRPAGPVADVGPVDDATLRAFLTSGETAAAGTATSSVDGRTWYYQVHRVGDLPFAVVRSHLASEVQRDWRRLSVGGALLLVIVGALGLLAFRTHQRAVAQRARLDALAHVDDLTGLANRRSFLQRAEQELARAARRSRPLALALLDLDGFKAINDRYGHAAGDEVLRAFADVCRRATRRDDVAARFGGDEFALLLPETSLEQANAVVERLRSATAQLSLAADGDLLTLTVSVGITHVVPRHDDGLDDLLRAVDAALYDAKRTGKDRVVSTDSGATNGA